MAFALIALSFALIACIVWQFYCHLVTLDKERAAFAAEREAWVRERRDLNNRIAVPQAAPFMSEDEQGPSKDDLPILPEFELDEAKVEEAKAELERLGYSEGLVG